MHSLFHHIYKSFANQAIFDVVTATNNIVSKGWASTAIDKTLNAANFALSLHNAMMLSTNIAETILDVLTVILDIGNVTDASGNPIDVGDWLKQKIEAVVKSLVGARNYTELSIKLTAANRIYQAGMNIIDNVMDLDEYTGENIRTNEEQKELKELVNKGKNPAYKVNHARILLLADTNQSGGGWKDQDIGEALKISVATIERVRQRLVEQGMTAALNRKQQQNRKQRRLDGEKEAHLIALTCSSAPEGQGRWTMKLLAEKMVELGHVESISPETVRQTLKKPKLNLG